MGKYMRKCSRGIGEVAVMEVTQVVGVQTRARALALAAAAASGEAPHGARPKRRKVDGGEFRVSYLQLRNRSLVLTPGKDRRAAGAGAAGSDSSATSRSSAAAAGNSGAEGQCGSGGGGEWDRVSRCSSNTSSEVLVAAAEAAAAAERARSRSGRPVPEVDDGSETTACNYDGDLQRWRERRPSSEPRERELDDLESTARPAESGGDRRRGAALAATEASAGGGPLMPPEAEIEEFFAAAEKQEWKRFAEKYNYDVVKDLPLEGRYEWVQIKP